MQAVIKQRCTAIHPVVEWRFRQAVLSMLERPEAGTDAGSEMEPIVFRDVHPLYALSDIRGSSNHRAWAIQGDLLAQLGLARDVLEAALPRAAHAHPRPDPAPGSPRTPTRSSCGWRAGDEAGVVAFLRPGGRDRSTSTWRATAPTCATASRPIAPPWTRSVGAVGKRRRAFEDTRGPHQRDHPRLSRGRGSARPRRSARTSSRCSAPTGWTTASMPATRLLEDGGFVPLHLKNLRLWQLMVACGIAVHVERVKPRMAEPLEITNLILVQHAPLAIRFRFDEKRFDVDGAYNVRYEIMKKRIDKAVVRGRRSG